MQTTVHLSAKKLNPAAQVAETAAGTTTSARLFISDRSGNGRFLIDTGATISVIPPAKRNQIPSDYVLYAANGTSIKTYGTRTLTLDLGLHRPLRWDFTIAAVERPIIGADFLSHHRLLVDIRGKQLIDRDTNLRSRGTMTREAAPTILTVPHSNRFGDLLTDFPNLTRPALIQSCVKHTVTHVIETKGRPVATKARRLAPAKYQATRNEFIRMIEEGICRPSKSPWASPLHVVEKPDGGIRPCGDYRRLNAQTVPDHYGVPNIADFNIGLHGKSIFSTLDLERAYFQIPVADEDIPKTAIITPFGLFEFTRMCFGLRNAAQTFQRFIDSIFRDLPYVFAYIDDLLIASDSEEDHKQHLQEVAKRLDAHGVSIKMSKCVFGQATVTFLGYQVSAAGTTPLPAKVDSITRCPKPATVKDLRRFLGMLNFYRRCLPHTADTQRPLNKFFTASKKNDRTPIVWTEETDAAFERCKDELRSAVRLGHPNPQAEITLDCDASETGIGAVLQQRDGPGWVPLGFFSKTLSAAQKKYSTYDRELLAIHRAIQHFRPILEGREFSIRTDHRPLAYAFRQPNENAPPQRTRYLNFISQFSTDIRHIAGESNVVADSLSRLEAIMTPDNLDALASAQRSASEVPALFKNRSLHMRWLSLPGSPQTVLCEVSTDNAKPYLPSDFRFEAFQRLHGLSHPGVRGTRMLVTQRYFWPGMNRDVAQWTRACIPCQQAKTHKHTISPLGSFTPSCRFDHLHVDLIGPLPPSEGKRYCLTMIDRFTHWPEVAPLDDISAESVARALCEQWISRFGVPRRITTDQGRQFESTLFRHLTDLLGIERIRTTPYHPQANGCIERWHRVLKSSLMARCSGENWTRHLPMVLLGIRAAVNTSNTCAAEMVYGQAVKLPGEFFSAPGPHPVDTAAFVQDLRTQIDRLKPAIPRTQHRRTFVPNELQTCSHVFVRVGGIKKSLTPPYEGPFKVLRRSAKHFLVQLSHRTAELSIDQLKPAFLLAEPDDRTPTPPPPPPATLVEKGVQPLAPTTPYTTRSGRAVRRVRFFE